MCYYLSIYLASVCANAKCQTPPNFAPEKCPQARSHPSDNGKPFSSDFGPFQGFKIRVPHGCLGKTSIFEIIMIGYVTKYIKARI